MHLGGETLGWCAWFCRSKASRERGESRPERRRGTGMFAAFHKHLKHRRDGFTLIEIIIVVAILGVLIALAMPRYMASRKKGYKAEGQDLLQEAKTLQWAYYQQYNFFD